MSLDDLILKVHHEGSSSSIKYNEVKVFGDLRARLSEKMPRYLFRLHGADLYFTDTDLISKAVYLGAGFRDTKGREGVQEFILEDPEEAGGVLARKNGRPNPIKRVWKAGFLQLRVKTGDDGTRQKKRRGKEKKGKWVQFYFVYCGVSLFWFKDVRAYQTGRTAEGCLPMGGLVPDLTDHIVDERPNAFVLKVPPNWGVMYSGQTLYLDCGAAQTKAEWVSALIDGRIRRKLCTMVQILPHIVAKFPNSVGLFRKAGHSEEIRHYMDQIDQGQYPDYASITNEHDLTGVMKRNLRNMTEPLLTQAKYAEFVSMGRIQDEKRRVDQLREAICSLPTMNRVFARELFEGLKEVSKYSEVSLMSPSNLAIVIGPNILRKDGMDPMRVVTDNDSIVDIVTTLIERCDQVFPNEGESEQLVNRVRLKRMSLTSIYNTGMPSLSSPAHSNSKPKVSTGSSFADRFKRRDQGLYGMPSKGAMPSFVSGPPPSFLSGPPPPVPPPNVKAISHPRPSVRNSNVLLSRPSSTGFNTSLQGSNTLSLSSMARTGSDQIPHDIQNETGLLYTASLPAPIVSEAKLSGVNNLGSPTSSRTKTRNNDRKSARKRKAKRGLPKRSGLPSTKSAEKSPSPHNTSKIRNITASINQNNKDAAIGKNKESGKASLNNNRPPVFGKSNEKSAGPPPFVEKKVTELRPPPMVINKRPQALTLQPTSHARKPGPPPAPHRTGRSKTVNTKPPSAQSRKPPKPPNNSVNKSLLVPRGSLEEKKSSATDEILSSAQFKSNTSKKPNKVKNVPGPPPQGSNTNLAGNGIIRGPPPGPGVISPQPGAVSGGPPARPGAGGPPPGPGSNNPKSPPDVSANGPGRSFPGPPPAIDGLPPRVESVVSRNSSEIASRSSIDVAKSGISNAGEEKDNIALEEGDDVIANRCEQALEICRVLQARQEENLNQIIVELEALNNMNLKFQSMLESYRIPRNSIAENLKSHLKNLDSQRLQYLDAMNSVMELMDNTLKSDDIICPSFVEDEELDEQEEYTQGEEHVINVYAKFPYPGGVRADNELVFEGGEIIVLLEENSGWSRGRIYNTSEEGWFPSSYVEELPESYFQDEG